MADMDFSKLSLEELLGEYEALDAYSHDNDLWDKKYDEFEAALNAVDSKKMDKKYSDYTKQKFDIKDYQKVYDMDVFLQNVQLSDSQRKTEVINKINKFRENFKAIKPKEYAKSPWGKNEAVLERADNPTLDSVIDPSAVDNPAPSVEEIVLDSKRFTFDFSYIDSAIAIEFEKESIDKAKVEDRYSDVISKYLELLKNNKNKTSISGVSNDLIIETTEFFLREEKHYLEWKGLEANKHLLDGKNEDKKRGQYNEYRIGIIKEYLRAQGKSENFKADDYTELLALATNWKRPGGNGEERTDSPAEQGRPVNGDHSRFEPEAGPAVTEEASLINKDTPVSASAYMQAKKAHWEGWCAGKNYVYEEVKTNEAAADFRFRYYKTEEDKNKGDYEADVHYPSQELARVKSRDGKPLSVEFWRSFAESANKSNQLINFSKIKNEDNKAKLLLACVVTGTDYSNVDVKKLNLESAFKELSAEDKELAMKKLGLDKEGKRIEDKKFSLLDIMVMELHASRHSDGDITKLRPNSLDTIKNQVLEPTGDSTEKVKDIYMRDKNYTRVTGRAAAVAEYIKKQGLPNEVTIKDYQKIAKAFEAQRSKINEETKTKQRDVYIVSQEGVNDIYNKWAAEALQEWFDMFPEYKDKYPVKDLGNYRDRDYAVDASGYASLSSEEKLLCFKVGEKYFRPYKSVDWFVGHSVIQGKSIGFDDNQICSDEFIKKLKEDQRNNNPQLSVSIVLNALKPNNDSGAPKFIYGHSAKGCGCVISIAHMGPEIKNLSLKELKERENFFKSLIMHEFTHVCSVRDGHCGNKNCIMEDWDTSIASIRAKNKANGIPPICDECQASVGMFFAKECGTSQDLNNSVSHYNAVRSRSRGGNVF